MKKILYLQPHTKKLEMNRLILIVFTLFTTAISAFSQTDLNTDPDSIVGEYEVLHQGECAKVRIMKEEDGTYSARIFWVDDMYDKHGRLRLDKKNPDKNLRDQAIDSIVIMTGLRYDAKKQQWGGTKIYDPTRGARANVHCDFRDRKGLRVRMTVHCFTQT